MAQSRLGASVEGGAEPVGVEPRGLGAVQLYAVRQWRQEIEALHGGAIRPRGGKDGGRQVVPDGEVAPLSLRQRARQAHDQRHAPRGVVVIVFVEQAVVVELRTVVGSEYDQRLLAQSGPVQVVEEAADLRVTVGGAAVAGQRVGTLRVGGDQQDVELVLHAAPFPLTFE